MQVLLSDGLMVIPASQKQVPPSREGRHLKAQLRESHILDAVDVVIIVVMINRKNKKMVVVVMITRKNGWMEIHRLSGDEEADREKD